MSDEDSNTIYVAQFRQHLAQLQAHLTGTDAEPLLPSYLPPTGYWTAEEKGLFFNALSVHSRFRPDLIAASVKTKSILDVCAYIDVLNTTLSRNHNLPSLRPTLECAMEVSDAWVQWEEGNAEELVAMEPKWEEETSEQQHEEEMAARDIDVENIMAAENVNPACPDLVAWKSDIQRIRRQEIALKRLDFHQLTVLEGFLRPPDSEIANKDADEATEDQKCLGIPDLAVPPSPTPPTARTHPFCDDMDPVLVRLSKSVPAHVLPQRRTNIVEATDRSPIPLKAGNTISPMILQPIVSRHPSPEDRPLSPGGDRALGANPSDLTPTSRRRFHKRLYMRRKRAEQRGEEAISNIAKLRPGRKVREPKSPKQRSKPLKIKNNTPSREENDDDDNTSMHVDTSPQTIPVTPPPDVKAPRITAEAQSRNTGSLTDLREDEEIHSSDDDDDQQKRHNTSGLTKPYKIKKDFTESGIDGNTLIEGNLDLFHLSTLGRFMQLYKSGYGKSTTTTTTISADTIRLMTVIIEEFTSEVVHRTIISREQDKRMKGDIKVYGRSHDEITPEMVEYVLNMMGMGGLTKEKYFAQLLGENVSGVPQVGSDAEEQPFLPTSLSILPELMTSTNEDGCIPVHTDEEDLEEELEEEHELDEADILLARQYEADLWKQSGLKHRHRKPRRGTRNRIAK